MTIPLKYAKIIELGLVEESEATTAVKPWLKGPGLFVLSGGVGSGKTMAACTWHPDLFVTAAHLARWPRYDMGEMSRLLRANRLVLDDLGTEYMDDKGNFMAMLDEVIADRYANDRPTLITTNLTVEQFKARYGERIADRIRDNGKFVSVGMSSKRHQSTPEELEHRVEAEEKLRAAKEALREKPLCNRHLYGAGECAEPCRFFGMDEWPKQREQRQARSEPMHISEIIKRGTP